jgi:hypothetical protein
MAKYFNYFPKTYYSLNDKSSALDVATNIIARFKFQNSLKNNALSFYEYSIKDSDTPEIIAHKFYKHSERHWIVLMFNDIVDPQYDWPLTYEKFNEFVDAKYNGPDYANSTTRYAGIEWASINTKSYYKVVTRTSFDSSIVERIELDLDAYDQLGESSANYVLADGTTITESITKLTKSYYEYEQDLNESKRNIKLLKPEFVPDIEKEFKRVIAK